MDITNKITQKYQKKIESGEIEMDKLLGSITKTMPGVKNMLPTQAKEQKKVIIDENFSTAKVKLGDKDKPKGGFNMSNMMNMMNGGKGGPNLSKLMGIMGKIQNVKTEDEAKDLKNQMDTYMQNDLGLNMEDFAKKLNLNNDK